MSRFFRHLFILFVIQLKIFRQIGIIALVISGLLPLLLIFFMKLVMTKVLTNVPNISETILFLITGNVVLGLSNVCIIMLSQSLSNMKEIKSFEYYTTLPISKLSLMLAILLTYLCISFPGFIFLLILGSLIFQFPLSLHPALFIILILTAFSFTGVGAIIGSYSRTQIEANLISQIVGFGLMLISPVFYPLEILPLPLKYFAQILPTTYAAHSLRMTVQGIFNIEVLQDISILLLITILSFIFTAKKIKWREA